MSFGVHCWRKPMPSESGVYIHGSGVFVMPELN